MWRTSPLMAQTTTPSETCSSCLEILLMSGKMTMCAEHQENVFCLYINTALWTIMHLWSYNVFKCNDFDPPYY
jgi:hypothetical protein